MNRLRRIIRWLHEASLATCAPYQLLVGIDIAMKIADQKIRRRAERHGEVHE